MMKKKLTQLLKVEIKEIQKLFGEASTRTYYRLFASTGKTFVLMAMPEGKMSVSEEITNLKEKQAELPYINVQKYLKAIRLPVPNILLFSFDDHWLVLEDLGDTKLFDRVNGAPPNEISKWYKKAIDLLIELQRSTQYAVRSTQCVAFQRSFDATLFNWEFDHFWEYYFKLSAISDQPSAKDKEIFIQETRKITEALCKLPTGFTHRDYQSRNLMLHNNQLYIIDFQDALLGPKVYDVVALLRDSYVDVTPYLDELLGYYCERSKQDLKILRKQFDLQTVQRKMKDAGRFVFIDQVKKNPNFLPYIPTSMDYVKQALERLPEYKGLYQMLKKYVKEW